MPNSRFDRFWRESMRVRLCYLFLAAAPAMAQETSPLAFRDVIAGALAKNSLIEAARERVRAAEAARTTAGTIANPVLTYFVENMRFPGRSTPTGLQPERSMYATFPLESLYQRGPRVRRAKEDIRAAEAELAAARWQVALEAARAFGRVALAQASLDASIELRRGLDELTEYNAKRVAEGVSPEGELIRIQVERNRAAIQEVLAQAELDSARAELRPFLHREPEAPRVLLVTAPFGLPPSALDEQLAAASGKQAEIVAARSRVEALRAEESYQGRLGLRQLGASFGAKDIGGQYSMIAGVSLPLPLLDRNQGERRRAEAERAAAERQLEWVERTVRARLDAARRRATVLHDHLAKTPPNLLHRAEEARQIALAAYREGAGSLLQVLDATRALAETRQTLTRLLLSQRESMIEFFAAAGLDPSDLLSSGDAR